jgi:two-component system, NtrC family, sensor kinase
MSLSELHTASSTPNSVDQLASQQMKIEQLRVQVAALEQLLEVYEQETIDKSTKLEQTLADLHSHTQRLTHAELTLGTLRSMLNSMEDAVVVVDQLGEFLLFNPSAERLLGIGENCSSLRSWAKSWPIYCPDQTTIYPLTTFPLLQAMQGEPVEATEIFVKSESADLWFSVTARSLCHADGTTHGGIAVFHNITHLKQAEIDLRQSETHSREQAQKLQQTLQDLHKTQAQLVQTEKMSSLGQLVAGIAHEINNPVNFIHGNLVYVQNYANDLLQFMHLWQSHYPQPHAEIMAEAEAIELDFLREDMPKMIASMKVGTERIRQIVLSLRNFSRLDEAEFKGVNIHDGIESTILILQHRLKPKSQDDAIVIEREYGDLPMVECYPGQLNQVFMNILANAIDALETDQAKSRQITIRTAVIEAQWVTITIADNGIGMLPQVQERIFNPFFTTKPVGKGTGMGMSISYQIITEKHGGALTCHSNVGEGTEFMIQIPIHQSRSD